MVRNALGSVVIETYVYDCFHFAAPQTANCGGEPKRSIGAYLKKGQHWGVENNFDTCYGLRHISLL